MDNQNQIESKAKELIEKFKPFMYCYMGSGMLSNTYDEKVVMGNARVCAVMCCDEIIAELEERGIISMFWKAVKEAIIKI